MSKKKRLNQKKLRKKIYKFIVAVLVLIFAISAFNVGKIFYTYYVARNVNNNAIAVALGDTGVFSGDVNFKALRKINPDVEAWLYQADSPINYPVVKGEDNEKYLYTLIDGTYNGGGTLFIDCRNSGSFKDFNTIIYGHHMKDNSMFRCLRGYTKEDGYYEGHKTFDLVTPDGRYTLVVFSSYITPAGGEAYTIDFPDAASKQLFINTALANSYINTGVEVTTQDRIVTLSTCAFDYEEARYVVVCKMVPYEG